MTKEAEFFNKLSSLMEEYGVTIDFKYHGYYERDVEGINFNFKNEEQECFKEITILGTYLLHEDFKGRGY